MTKTAQDYRDEAAATEKRVAESWERSDTDGFLSQWAGGLTAQLARAKATILENGGKADFPGLFEGDTRLKAKMIRGKFPAWDPKMVWLLTDDAEAARLGRRFIPTGENSRIQRDLGLAEREEIAPAWAAMKGSGTGLSGNAWVAVFRTDGGYPGAKELEASQENMKAVNKA